MNVPFINVKYNYSESGSYPIIWELYRIFIAQFDLIAHSICHVDDYAAHLPHLVDLCYVSELIDWLIDWFFSAAQYLHNWNRL